MHPLSVVIITFNEEQNIRRCIESVQRIADEIIVLDSFSTDQTVEIARSLGAIVHTEKFRGYIGQKNHAIWLATHNYILSLDGDEALNEKSIDSILEEKKTFTQRAYSINRCTSYCGHFIRHGLWYPDRKIRLFDRRVAQWGGLNPHDHIHLNDGLNAKHIDGEILHYSYHTPDDLIWQNNRMSSIAASSLYAAGYRSNWFKMLLRPAWAFVNGYFLRLGLLDGADGFTIAINMSHQVFLKYSKLYRLQKSHGTNLAITIEKAYNREKRSAANEG